LLVEVSGAGFGLVARGDANNGCQLKFGSSGWETFWKTQILPYSLHYKADQ